MPNGEGAMLLAGHVNKGVSRAVGARALTHPATLLFPLSH